LGLLAPYVASLSFAGSLVFYNSYLPEIAAPEEQDELSARGFAMGYFGSSFLLIAVLVAVQNPGWFGPLATVGLVTRWSFVLVALWWVGFGEYALVRLPRGAAHLEGEKTPPPRPSSTYKALYTAVAELLTDRALRRFVLAFFFASAGVQTVILIASLFGSQVLGLSTSSLIVTILMIQYVAMAGAWSFARISKRWGNMATLILGVCGWIAVCVGAYFVQNEGQFYALGAAVGLVMGGLQSLTRSTYAKMLPEAEDHVTYFSFYDIAEKLATVLGMVSVGWLETVTGNLRLSALLLVGYFLVALYFWVRIRRYTFNPHTASQA
jgi:UMF1 family MFS transporter